MCITAPSLAIRKKNPSVLLFVLEKVPISTTKGSVQQQLPAFAPNERKLIGYVTLRPAQNDLDWSLVNGLVRILDLISDLIQLRYNLIFTRAKTN